MFESLSERIHQDEDREESRSQRLTRYGFIGLISVAVIAALIGGVQMIR